MTFPDRHTHRYVSSAVQGGRDVTTSQPIIYRPAQSKRKGMHWTRRVLLGLSMLHVFPIAFVLTAWRHDIITWDVAAASMAVASMVAAYLWHLAIKD